MTERAVFLKELSRCFIHQYEADRRNVSEGWQKVLQFISKEQESTVCTLSTSKEIVTSIARTEFSSENDVFVSCLSTMSSLGGSLASALDHAGRTQSSDLWHAPSGPYRTLSEDLTLASQSV